MSEQQIAYLWVPEFGAAVTRRADPRETPMDRREALAAGAIGLIAAAVVWASATLNGAAISEHDTVIVVSLAIGAMVANVISVVLLMIETASLRR